MRRSLITALMLALASQSLLFADSAKKEADLPKVLIIGDSISKGYTPHVAQILEVDAIVIPNKGKGKHTGEGLKKIDLWIGKTKWDVIHFNWGLWDLCYRHPKSKVQGRRDKVNGTITTPIELYEENLDKLVTRPKGTDAKLIWGHTTVVPEKEAGRFVGDDKKYNKAAAKVMRKHDIPIDDLHSLTADFPADLFTKPGDVHYTQDGYKKIAQQVADEILRISAAGRFAEEAPGEPFDYNFDGHLDYRVLTDPDAKSSRFDVFIYDPELKKHVKDMTLSGLVYPYPDPKTKRVFSIHTGGHSGALFTGTAYTWNGTGFDYAFSVRQECVQIDGKIHYIRVKAKMVDGKPVIFSVEPGDPHWDDKGMSIE